MKKILEDELMSLAHRILQMKERDDIEKLQTVAGQLYDKLTVLAFTEKYFEGPRPSIGKSAIQSVLKEEHQASFPTQPEDREDKQEDRKLEKSETDFQSTENIREEQHSKEKATVENKPNPEPAPPEEAESSADNLRNIAVHYDDLPQFEPLGSPRSTKTTSENKETLPTDKENTTPKRTPSKKPEESKSDAKQSDLFSSPKPRTKNDLTSHQPSLNERFHQGFNFGLNDRLVFINNLFEGSATDFNRVISQLNTFHTFTEAKTFIEEQVKPDYDWDNKEVYEERFILAIEKRLG